MDLLLALDAGTTGVRAVAFDGAARRRRHRLPRAHPALPLPRRGRARPRRDRAPGRRHPGRGGRGAPKPAATTSSPWALTNQRETTVAFDRDSGAAAPRALVWQDRRTADACAALADAGHEPAVRATTGLVLDPYFSATKMRWLLDHGALDAMSAAGAGDGRHVAAVVAHRRGRRRGLRHRALQRGAHLARGPRHARLVRGRWPGLFGVPTSALARVVASCGRFGEVSANAVPELAGVPITGVLGDQQAALFGQACFEPGRGQGHLRHRGVRPLPGRADGARRGRRSRDDGRLGPRRLRRRRLRARGLGVRRGSCRAVAA